MDVQSRRGGRALAADLAPHLDAWTTAHPHTPHVHSGDVGWHLRAGEAAVEGTLLAWDVDGIPVAAGLLDTGVLRTAFAPGWSVSSELAAQVAGQCADLDYVDALSGTALRHHLLGAGWSADPDPWVVLHKDLGLADAEHDDPDTRPVDGSADVEERVAVQRSAFAPGSTFTPALWEQMAASPTYDRRFEMVTRTPDGKPAAAATGWFAGPGANRDLRAGGDASRPSAPRLRPAGQPRGDGGAGPGRRERHPGAHARVEPGGGAGLRVLRPAAGGRDAGGHPGGVTAVAVGVRAGSTSGSAP